MAMTPKQAANLLITRDAEHNETAILDMLEAAPDEAVPMMTSELKRLRAVAHMFPAPANVFFYRVLWFGWDRLIAAWSERLAARHADESNDHGPPSLHP